MTTPWQPWLATPDSVCPCPGAEVEVMFTTGVQDTKAARQFYWHRKGTPDLGAIIAYRIVKPAPRKPLEVFVNEYPVDDDKYVGFAYQSEANARQAAGPLALRVAVRCVEVV